VRTYDSAPEARRIMPWLVSQEYADADTAC
jgi:hypothetical protein